MIEQMRQPGGSWREDRNLSTVSDGQSTFPVENLDWLNVEMRNAVPVELEATTGEIREFLTAIYEHEEYQAFLSQGQFELTDEGPARFRVPPEIIGRHGTAFRLLSNPRCGLVRSSGILEVKVNRYFDAVHVTDGYWTPASVRVFSTTDESIQICNYIRSKSLDRSHSILIDPACGSGAHALGSGFDRVVCLDVGVRAITYARLNAILNNSAGWLLGLNDIRSGLPTALSAIGEDFVYAVNMPFAIMPKIEVPGVQLDLVPAQDGGDHGMSLTQAALSALRSLWQSSKRLRRVTAVVLFYSLGRSEEGPWEIEDVARRILPDGVPTLTLMSQERMWRVNGRKVARNPMPLSELELKADCRMTWRASEEQLVREGYRALGRQLVEEGWSHLGYGLLEIRLER